MAAHPPQLPPEPAAPVQNTEFTQRYLYAFATQGEIQNHVRTQTVEAESVRLPEIMTQWSAQQPAVQALMQAEATLANQAQILPIPPGHEAVLETISNDA